MRELRLEEEADASPLGRIVPALAGQPRQTQVDNLHDVMAINQYVARVDVTVGHSLLVQMGVCFENPAGEAEQVLAGFRVTSLTELGTDRVGVGSRTPFHQQVRPTLPFARAK